MQSGEGPLLVVSWFRQVYQRRLLTQKVLTYFAHV